MVYLILGAGFEEAEAIVPCDLLRRAGVEVRLAGIGGTDIPGSHGIPVHADCAAEAAELTKADMLILPGGLGGVRSIRGCEPVLCAAREMAQAGKWVAAICAAPSVLASLGLLEGRNATAHAGFQDKLAGAHVLDAEVVVDGNITTSYGLGGAIPFALELVRQLAGQTEADRIRNAIAYRH